MIRKLTLSLMVLLALSLGLPVMAAPIPPIVIKSFGASCDGFLLTYNLQFASGQTITVSVTDAQNTTVATAFYTAVVGDTNAGVNFDMQPVDGTLTVTVSGTNLLTDTATTEYSSSGCGALPTPLDPAGDEDADGVQNDIDNCPFVPNPDQADFWGSDAGNACDNSQYDTGNGAVIFPQKDGDIRAYGNCKVPAGAENAACVIIAETDADTLAALSEGDFARFETPEGEGYFVEVYLATVAEDGTRIYQVYVYEPGGNLLDNSYIFIVEPSR